MRRDGRRSDRTFECIGLSYDLTMIPWEPRSRYRDTECDQIINLGQM